MIKKIVAIDSYNNQLVHDDTGVSNEAEKGIEIYNKKPQPLINSALKNCIRTISDPANPVYSHLHMSMNKLLKTILQDMGYVESYQDSTAVFSVFKIESNKKGEPNLCAILFQEEPGVSEDVDVVDSKYKTQNEYQKNLENLQRYYSKNNVVFKEKRHGIIFLSNCKAEEIIPTMNINNPQETIIKNKKIYKTCNLIITFQPHENDVYVVLSNVKKSYNKKVINLPAFYNEQPKNLKEIKGSWVLNQLYINLTCRLKSNFKYYYDSTVNESKAIFKKGKDLLYTPLLELSRDLNDMPKERYEKSIYNKILGMNLMNDKQIYSSGIMLQKTLFTDVFNMTIDITLNNSKPVTVSIKCEEDMKAVGKIWKNFFEFVLQQELAGEYDENTNGPLYPKEFLQHILNTTKQNHLSGLKMRDFFSLIYYFIHNFPTCDFSKKCIRKIYNLIRSNSTLALPVSEYDDKCQDYFMQARNMTSYYCNHNFNEGKSIVKAPFLAGNTVNNRSNKNIRHAVEKKQNTPLIQDNFNTEKQPFVLNRDENNDVQMINNNADDNDIQMINDKKTALSPEKVSDKSIKKTRNIKSDKAENDIDMQNNNVSNVNTEQDSFQTTIELQKEVEHALSELNDFVYKNISTLEASKELLINNLNKAIIKASSSIKKIENESISRSSYRNAAKKLDSILDLIIKQHSSRELFNNSFFESIRIELILRMVDSVMLLNTDLPEINAEFCSSALKKLYDNYSLDNYELFCYNNNYSGNDKYERKAGHRTQQERFQIKSDFAHYFKRTVMMLIKLNNHNIIEDYITKTNETVNILAKRYYIFSKGFYGKLLADENIVKKINEQLLNFIIYKMARERIFVDVKKTELSFDQAMKLLECQQIDILPETLSRAPSRSNSDSKQYITITCKNNGLVINAFSTLSHVKTISKRKSYEIGKKEKGKGTFYYENSMELFDPLTMQSTGHLHFVASNKKEDTHPVEKFKIVYIDSYNHSHTTLEPGSLRMVQDIRGRNYFSPESSMVGWKLIINDNSSRSEYMINYHTAVGNRHSFNISKDSGPDEVLQIFNERCYLMPMSKNPSHINKITNDRYKEIKYANVFFTNPFQITNKISGRIEKILKNIFRDKDTKSGNNNFIFTRLLPDMGNSNITESLISEATGLYESNKRILFEELNSFREKKMEEQDADNDIKINDAGINDNIKNDEDYKNNIRKYCEKILDSYKDLVSLWMARYSGSLSFNIKQIIENEDSSSNLKSEKNYDEILKKFDDDFDSNKYKHPIYKMDLLHNDFQDFFQSFQKKSGILLYSNKYDDSIFEVIQNEYVKHSRYTAHRFFTQQKIMEMPVYYQMQYCVSIGNKLTSDILKFHSYDLIESKLEVHTKLQLSRNRSEKGVIARETCKLLESLFEHELFIMHCRKFGESVKYFNTITYQATMLTNTALDMLDLTVDHKKTPEYINRTFKNLIKICDKYLNKEMESSYVSPCPPKTYSNYRIKNHEYAKFKKTQLRNILDFIQKIIKMNKMTTKDMDDAINSFNFISESLSGDDKDSIHHANKTCYLYCSLLFKPFKNMDRNMADKYISKILEKIVQAKKGCSLFNVKVGEYLIKNIDNFNLSPEKVKNLKPWTMYSIYCLSMIERSKLYADMKNEFWFSYVNSGEGREFMQNFGMSLQLRFSFYAKCLNFVNDMAKNNPDNNYYLNQITEDFKKNFKNKIVVHFRPNDFRQKYCLRHDNKNTSNKRKSNDRNADYRTHKNRKISSRM
ncbi:MAG: hypothetical protein GY730_09810 [bacterium]|nr:hypothetical protein [bacterium]